MNMETTSNTDLDKLEELLHNKMFDKLSPAEKQWVANKLSEEEYTSMSALYAQIEVSKLSINIEPKADTKLKLNNALAIKFSKPGVLKLKMPVYQSVAVALIFFLVGFGINMSRPVETKIVHSTVQVIKYLPSPQNHKDLAKVASKPIKSNTKRKKYSNSNSVNNLHTINNVAFTDTNPEVIRQQEIAMTNINRVRNEQNGSSMGGDTLLQKMLVTVY